MVEAAASRVVGQPVRLHASGRTDAGVHARQQVAHFDVHGLRDPDLRALSVGINSLLPPDIRVLGARRVPRTFHARLSAREKEYRYFIYCGRVVSPFLYRYRWHIPGELDCASMEEAARRLTGRHDFASFTANPNRPVGDTRRELRQLAVRRRGATVVIIARADGFLYRMVRSLVGYLVRVGKGELSPSSARRILSQRCRTAEVPTAPPCGLFLWRVIY